MFWNGKTAIDGLVRDDKDAAGLTVVFSGRARNTFTGREIFFSCCSPASSKLTSSLP